MIRYRIRVGKAAFADPHYVTATGANTRYTSLLVNPNPCSWKKRDVAEKHLTQLKQIYRSAELESYQTPQPT